MDVGIGTTSGIQVQSSGMANSILSTRVKLSKASNDRLERFANLKLVHVTVLILEASLSPAAGRTSLEGSKSWNQFRIIEN